MTRFFRRACPLVIVLLLASLCIAPARAEDDSPDLVDGIPAAELLERISMPLEDGFLDMGNLMGTLLDRVSLNGEQVRRRMNWRINVKGRLGELKLAPLKAVVGKYVGMDVGAEALVVTFDRLAIRRDEKDLRGKLRLFAGKFMPQEAAEAALRYGMDVHENGRIVPLEDAKLGGRVVVLIHGLDDPGRLWAELTPKLVRAGFVPCEITYPNDQPIVKSVDDVATHLAALRQRGVTRLNIVAHSMGGLISRELLTSPEHYNGDARGGTKYPHVEKLIMLGTPNAGSQCARLDLAAEMREQAIRAFSGDGLLFGSIFDGAGEARIDLIPKSEFLLRLNNRSMPKHVRMTIVAGRASPLKAGQIDTFKKMMAVRFADHADKIDALGAAVADLAEGLGDGVVSLESAKLEGVEDFVMVDGNHVSMIRRYITSNGPVPPAVPVVMDRLEE
jgi:pimeloyl-ACP methyl ester carboxylesterase